MNDEELEVTPVEIVEDDEELDTDELDFSDLDILFSEDDVPTESYILIDVTPE